VPTIRNANTKADLISAINEENQTNTIRRRFNALGETFEGVVLSNWEQTGTDTVQEIKDTSQPPRSWYLVRVRAKDESDSMRLSPYGNDLPREEIYRRINDHRQAQIAKDMIGDGKVPAHGTHWQCRYAGKNYTPPIILEQYLKDGSSADKIQANKNASGEKKKSPDDPKPAVKTVAEIKAETPSVAREGMFAMPAVKSERLTLEEKLATLEPTMRPKIESVLAALRTQGFQPKIYFAWRSLAEQKEIFLRGNSKVQFSFHTAYKNGKPNAYAVDIIDKRWAWGADAAKNGFWEALGKAGKAEGLYWGGDWKTFKDYAHLQFYDNHMLGKIKTESGLPECFTVRPKKGEAPWQCIEEK